MIIIGNRPKVVAQVKYKKYSNMFDGKHSKALARAVQEDPKKPLLFLKRRVLLPIEVRNIVVLLFASTHL